MIYDQLRELRRLAVILDSGHNTFADACAKIKALGGLSR